MTTTVFENKWGAHFLDNVPNRPGVYWFTDENLEWVYVGKASNLHRRLNQYHQANRDFKRSKRYQIVKASTHLEFKTLNSEQEALLEENRLIQKHRPSLNIEGKFSFLYSSLGLGYRDQCLYLSHGKIAAAEDWFEYFGCFRSPSLTKETTRALARLIGFLGHQEKPSALKHLNRQKYTGLVAFRRIDPSWHQLLRTLLSGKSDAFLIELSLSLLDKASARRDSQSVQEDLEIVKTFFLIEAQPLRKAFIKLNLPYRWLSQQERDPLFIKSRSQGTSSPWPVKAAD